ncbi:hypothetical protein L4C34_10160 [Vibrio profundum]|uniref:hypothetical protein n=1 Tax=Vibrio profundum TaxID=2910247 RepID=UPI003D1451E7
MTDRNIHGDWSITFKDRFMLFVVKGATNDAAALAAFKEIKQLVLSSPQSDKTPWVFLNDGRQWEMDSANNEEIYADLLRWLEEHNCIYYALVNSSKIQEFALERQIPNLGILEFSFDYDEAYATCLRKLEEGK